MIPMFQKAVSSLKACLPLPEVEVIDLVCVGRHRVRLFFPKTTKNEMMGLL